MGDTYLSYFTTNERFPFFIQYGEHSEELQKHRHTDFIELTIVLNGHARHLVNDEFFYISQGDVFVLSDDISHGFDNLSDFKICNIMFKPQIFNLFGYDLTSIPGFHGLFLLEPQYNKKHSFTNRLRLTAKDYIELKKLIDICVSTYNSTNPGKDAMTLSYFMQIVIKLSWCYSLISPDDEIDGLARVLSYLETNYMNEICIEELHLKTNYSDRHFMRLFSKTFSTTPLKYLTSIRMRHACELLQSDEYTVSEISDMCGFSDSNYFTRVFKSTTGLSPTAYRSHH